MITSLYFVALRKCILGWQLHTITTSDNSRNNQLHKLNEKSHLPSWDPSSTQCLDEKHRSHFKTLVRIYCQSKNTEVTSIQLQVHESVKMLDNGCTSKGETAVCVWGRSFCEFTWSSFRFYQAEYTSRSSGFKWGTAGSSDTIAFSQAVVTLYSV